MKSLDEDDDLIETDEKDENFKEELELEEDE